MSSFDLRLVFFIVCFLWSQLICFGMRAFPNTVVESAGIGFHEAPEYRNGVHCRQSTVHVAMTLDSEYLRGSIAAVHSIRRHASCPENIFFHFISAEFDSTRPQLLSQLVRSTFPSLAFNTYIFREQTVINLISSSVRQALENPLNYARNYLGDILDSSVDRVIYLDSDIVLVDDITRLWNTKLTESRVIGAPQYCHANFTKYFTNTFWSDPTLTRVFESSDPCYFNTGVMIIDLKKFRKGKYKNKLEKWMRIQKIKKIYELGSLPPFLLVFGGKIEPIDHRWNQHGLGGDNVSGSCRPLHPGPVSLLHWSGKDKPWVRLDDNKPCPLDYLWKPYDLYKTSDYNH